VAGWRVVCDRDDDVVEVGVGVGVVVGWVEAVEAEVEEVVDVDDVVDVVVLAVVLLAADVEASVGEA